MTSEEKRVPVISLMTDFGIKDGTVGVMKGVIWGICPSAQISDLSHMIQPQNVREAAYILARSVPYYPNESIHMAVWLSLGDGRVGAWGSEAKRLLAGSNLG